MSKFEDETRLKQAVYEFVDNLMVVLVPMSLYEPYRLQLSGTPKTYEFLKLMFPRLITKCKKQGVLLDNFLLFFSNLCAKESKLKEVFMSPEEVIGLISSLD